MVAATCGALVSGCAGQSALESSLAGLAESVQEVGAATFVHSRIFGNLSVSEDAVVFAVAAGEGCGGFDSVVGRVALANHALTEYTRSCDSPTQPVADGASLFYLEWKQDDLRRIDQATGANTLLAETRGAIKHRGLQVDGTHAYWADDDGLKRIPRLGGAVELVAGIVDGDTIWLGPIDTSFAYVTLANASTRPRKALYRVRLTGGVLELLAGPDEGPFEHLVVDGGYLYWWRTGADIRRLFKLPGNSSTRLIFPRPLVGGMAVNTRYLFWTQTGTAGGTGEVMRYNKDAYSEGVLFGGVPAPDFVGVNSHVVVWRQAGDTIMKAVLPTCGDGVCTDGENCGICDADCGACPYCGDGTCNGGEDCGTCATDCGICTGPFCGDGNCDFDEDCSSCRLDCGRCPRR